MKKSPLVSKVLVLAAIVSVGLTLLSTVRRSLKSGFCKNFSVCMPLTDATPEDISISHELPTAIDSSKTYSQVKAEIKSELTKLRSTEVSDDSLSQIFAHNLVDRLFPYWYGTPWDFNGYTANPNEGVIACGYFVSTTLLHAGVRVDRYKLAQQLPVHEAQSLAIDQEVLIVEGATTESIIAEIDSLTKEGIYFLGLDQSHVGYLYKKDSALYLIHSNYLGTTGVTAERLEESAAFMSFYKFYLVPLSANQTLIRYWLEYRTVPVIEG